MASDYMYSNVMCMGGEEGKRGGEGGGGMSGADICTGNIRYL